MFFVACVYFKGIIMSISIKTCDDIKVFKKFVLENPLQPICYVFYKNNLRFPNVYYVGFTNQPGIKKYIYLNKHHKMNDLYNNLMYHGYSVNIYIKYSERSLIRLFKPILNLLPGNGMNSYRNIDNENKYNECGDIIDIKCKRLNVLKKRDIRMSYVEEVCNEVINNNLLYKKSNYNYINYKFMIYIIEKYKSYKMSIKDDNIVNDLLFSSTIDEKNVGIDIRSQLLTYPKLLSILTICKLDKIWVSYVTIHEILKKNINWHLNNLNTNENKCSSCGKIYKKKFNLVKHINNTRHRVIEDWINSLHAPNNKYIMCAEILESLRDNNYLISSFNINESNIWFYYRPSLKYNAAVVFYKENKQVNCSPYNLEFQSD